MQETDQSEYYSGLPVSESETPQIAPSPDNPPWNSGMAFGVWLFSVLLILFVPAMVVLPYIISSGPAFTDAEAVADFAKNDTTAILLQVAAILPAHLLTLIASYFVVTAMRRHDFREMLGWSAGGVKWWAYPAILIGFLGLAAVLSLYLPEVEHELMRILRSSRIAVYLVAILATLTAPIVEEVIYRGILYSAFQRSMGVAGAFGLVTLLFTAVHVPQYYESVSTLTLLTLLSVVLTALRVYSRNLLPCIILHTLFNGFQSIILVLEPWLPPQTEPTAIDPAFIFSLLR